MEEIPPKSCATGVRSKLINLNVNHMIVYPSGRVQLSYSERKNGSGEIQDSSLLINIRSQNVDDCVELYHETRRRLEKNVQPADKLLVSFNDELEEKRTCPDCKSPLKIRVGRNGPFAGCIRYPQCHHTERV